MLKNGQGLPFPDQLKQLKTDQGGLWKGIFGKSVVHQRPCKIMRQNRENKTDTVDPVYNGAICSQKI